MSIIAIQSGYTFEGSEFEVTEWVEIGDSPWVVVGPEIPPECWNTTPVDPSRAWDAVVAMCR